MLHHERLLTYVAGPYSSPDPVANTHLAVKVGERLQESGIITAVVPHLSLLWHIISPHTDVEFWYDYDLAILARCDALFRFPGKSSGADREVQFAESQEIPVFHDEALLLTFAKTLLDIRATA